jgi:retron-type reverse transcriptase
LIARALKAGITVDGKFEKNTKGCPQGSPLSPMLSNIVLNELDQELEKKGHRYRRWANDFVKSEGAAIRVTCRLVTDFFPSILHKSPSKDRADTLMLMERAANYADEPKEKQTKKSGRSPSDSSGSNY